MILPAEPDTFGPINSEIVFGEVQKTKKSRNQEDTNMSLPNSASSFEDQDPLGQYRAMTSCPLSLFTNPSSRATVDNPDDRLALENIISKHRASQDPVLYFKWGIWTCRDNQTSLVLEDIVETEVQLVTWLKQIGKDSPTESAFLRLGLHPDRVCGKVAIKASAREATELFKSITTEVLCENISKPMALHIPVIGVDLSQRPSSYTIIKLWLGPKLDIEESVLDQIISLLKKLKSLLAKNYEAEFSSAVYINEIGKTVPGYEDPDYIGKASD